MSVQSNPVSLHTLDGLHLLGTLDSPETPTDRAVVMINCGGVTREEGGFIRMSRRAAG